MSVDLRLTAQQYSGDGGGLFATVNVRVGRGVKASSGVGQVLDFLKSNYA